MMHDLFTRGVDAYGHLTPPLPKPPTSTNTPHWAGFRESGSDEFRYIHFERAQNGLQATWRTRMMDFQSSESTVSMTERCATRTLFGV